LGPTVTAMRLPCALLGVATVWAMYSLVRRWFGTAAGLCAAAILALDPWHLSFTRTAHEAAFAPFFLVASLWAWQRAGLLPSPVASVNDDVRMKSIAAWAFVGGLLMGFHAWVYPATRLFTPLFLTGMVCLGVRPLIVLWKDRTTRRGLQVAMIGLIVGALPLWWTALNQPERLAARARAVLIFAQPWPLTMILLEFMTNLGRNLDPRYLFWQCEDMSGAPIPRVGQHLLLVAPIFAVGMIHVLADCRRRTWARWMVLWFVLAVLPAAICCDWNPHPFRAIAGLPVYPILSSIGATWIVHRVSRWPTSARKATRAFAIMAILVNLAHFAYGYYWRFPRNAEPGYQTPLLKAFQVVARHAKEADFILVTNRANQPYIYSLLCQPIPPRELATTPNIITDDRLGFYQVLRVGKYYFAPRDPEKSPEAAARFQEAIGAWPPTARGLVIERAGRFKEGELLTAIPCGDGSRADQNIEVRWWRPGDQRPGPLLSRQKP